MTIITILYIVGVLLTFGILMGIDLGDESVVIFGSILFPIFIIVTIGVKIGEFIASRTK